MLARIYHYLPNDLTKFADALAKALGQKQDEQGNERQDHAVFRHNRAALIPAKSFCKALKNLGSNDHIVPAVLIVSN